MAVKKLTQVGDNVLRLDNLEINDFAFPAIKKVIKDLKDTMYHTGLVGIAAPQIGQNLQIFLTHPRNTKSRKLFKEDALRIFINPKITRSSKERSTIYEGCGSVADGELFGPVARSAEITIEACNAEGKIFSLNCDGLLARVIQHEIDHLNGIEFIQKVSDYSKVISGKIYRQSIRNSKEQLEALKITKLIVE
jgi:peptide deformylase